MWFKKKDFKTELKSNYDALMKYSVSENAIKQFPVTYFNNIMDVGVLLRNRIRVFVGRNIKEITKYTEDQIMKFEFKEETGLGTIRFDAKNEKYLNIETEEQKMMSLLLGVAIPNILIFMLEIRSKDTTTFEEVSSQMDDLIKDSEKGINKAKDFIKKVKEEENKEKGEK